MLAVCGADDRSAAADYPAHLADGAAPAIRSVLTPLCCGCVCRRRRGAGSRRSCRRSTYRLIGRRDRRRALAALAHRIGLTPCATDAPPLLQLRRAASSHVAAPDAMTRDRARRLRSIPPGAVRAASSIREAPKQPKNLLASDSSVVRRCAHACSRSFALIRRASYVHEALGRVPRRRRLLISPAVRRGDCGRLLLRWRGRKRRLRSARFSAELPASPSRRAGHSAAPRSRDAGSQ